jgi:hypothetical protein
MQNASFSQFNPKQLTASKHYLKKRFNSSFSERKTAVYLGVSSGVKLN